MSAEIAVFGLGNPLMSDEGIGIHVLETLALARELGTLPKTVVIFGIEPERIAPGLDLSPALAERLESYAEQVLREVRGDEPAG